MRGVIRLTVTFCGHSEVPDREPVRGWLTDVCELLIKDGATEFYLGGYGAFDRLCADVLQERKRRHAHIRLFWCFPISTAPCLRRATTRRFIRRWNRCPGDTLFCAETNG